MIPPARRRWPVVAAVLVLLAVEAIVALAPRPAHLERDVAQERLDAAGAPIGPAHTLGQTFTVRRNGLRRIEFLAVVADPARLPAEGMVCLDLERLDAPATTPLTSCLPIAGLVHNQVLAFDLPARPDSRGASYRLTLRGEEDLGLSVWLTNHEAYSGGQAYEDGAPRDGDLYFRTFYDYRPADALADLVAGLGRRAWPIAVTALMLLAPGVSLLLLIPTGRRLEPVVALTLAAALSLAYWPLTLLWATTLGLRLGPLGAWLAIALPAVAATARIARPRWASLVPSTSDGPRLTPQRLLLHSGANTQIRPYEDELGAGGDPSVCSYEDGLAAGVNPKIFPYEDGLGARGNPKVCPYEDGLGAGGDSQVRPSEGGMGTGWGSRVHPGRGDRRVGADPRVRPHQPISPVPSASEGPCLTRRFPFLRTRDPWPYVALALIMLLVIATRALQVRDLALPAWVDSVHHTMIARLIADAGRVPASYRPFMPVDAFHYHFGFHAGAAALRWLSGARIEDAVLLYGQALNVLAPLATYTLAWWLGRGRWGGVAAALVVGALSYMPAYYVTWGRYTQLAGLVMLPPLVLLTTWALGTRKGASYRTDTRPLDLSGIRSAGVSPASAARERGALDGSAAYLGDPRMAALRAVVGPVLLAAILLAGLVLTHYRVLVFYVLLALPLAGLLLWRATRLGREGGGKGDAASTGPDAESRPGRRSAPWWVALRRILTSAALCGGLALLLALPWVLGFLVRVGSGFGDVYGGWAGDDGGNAVPVALLTVGWTRPLLTIAAVGALWGVVRRRGEAIVLALCIGLCLLAANPHLLGFADTWFLTNSAVVIAFWLPMGALAGWLVGDLARLAVCLPARWRAPRLVLPPNQARLPLPKVAAAIIKTFGRGGGYALLLGRVGRRAFSASLLVVAVALAVVGSWRQVDIVNPVTVLVEEDDLAAMAWARDNIPPEAILLVSTGVWQGPMRYGTDAGWWLNVLADRRTTFPSLLYVMGGQAYVAERNALGVAVEEAESKDDPALLERLKAAGVTHVYVGARGGHLLPKDLDPSPHYRALYVRGPVRIYEIVYP